MNNIWPNIIRLYLLLQKIHCNTVLSFLSHVLNVVPVHRNWLCCSWNTKQVLRVAVQGLQGSRRHSFSFISTVDCSIIPCHLKSFWRKQMSSNSNHCVHPAILNWRQILAVIFLIVVLNKNDTKGEDVSILKQMFICKLFQCFSSQLYHCINTDSKSHTIGLHGERC